MVTAFAVCAVVGVLVLIASLLLGDFEIGGVEIGSADAGLPWLSAPALAAAVGVFGVVGWPLSAGTSLPEPVVVGAAAASGVAAYGLLMLVLRAMRRAQTGTVAGLRAAVGTIGELSMEIPVGGWGRVSYVDSESVRATTTAVLVDAGASAPGGQQVLIVDVDGDRLVVQPLETQAGSQAPGRVPGRGRESMTVSILIAAGAAVIVILLALWIFFHNYIKSPPDQVAIFTGRGEMKVVRGGARFKVPGLERVDYMPLRPFEIRIALSNARSIDGVPVELQAVGLVRIGTTDEMTRTAAQRFLTANMGELENQINEILAGSLRGIAATMTVEQLNSNREALARGVVDEAGGDLSRIGMEVDILKIAGIEDRNGYLESLGQKRIAEVKRDADIGKAEAERDSLIRSADARRAGEIAQTEAETAIAEAQQGRDVRIAQLRAQTEAQNAEADQAGPLAKAKAEKAVGIALEEAEAARVEARTEVERKRRAQAEASLDADVIAPAEAARQAAVARAEGERQAAILAAEATAESTRLDGESKAQARKSAAAALEAELRADAAGKQAQAEAFNQYNAEAVRLLLAPQVLATVEASVRAQSEATAAIDSINIIGGGGNDATGGLLGLSGQSVAAVVAALKSQGIDLGQLLGAAPGETVVVDE